MPQKKSIDDQSVLEKALLVISELGPESFTLADIGKAVGLAPATLMQRFGNKKQLLTLAAKQASVTQKHHLEALKKRNLGWEKELLILLSAVPKGIGSRADIASSLGLLKLDMVDPELHPLARSLFTALRHRMHELLVEGQQAGVLDPNIDMAAITWELDALHHGLIIQWTLSGKGSLQQWLKDGFKQYFKKKKK